MASDQHLIGIKSYSPDTRAFILLKPDRKPVAKREFVWRDKGTLLPLVQSFREFIGHFLAGFAIEGNALDFSCCVTTKGDTRFPASIFAPSNGPLVIAAFRFLCHAAPLWT